MKDKEKWMELCRQACAEQDPDKLMELISEINRLLDEKENRLKAIYQRASDGLSGLSATRGVWIVNLLGLPDGMLWGVFLRSVP